MSKYNPANALCQHVSLVGVGWMCSQIVYSLNSCILFIRSGISWKKSLTPLLTPLLARNALNRLDHSCIDVWIFETYFG